MQAKMHRPTPEKKQTKIIISYMQRKEIRKFEIGFSLSYSLNFIQGSTAVDQMIIA